MLFSNTDKRNGINTFGGDFTTEGMYCAPRRESADPRARPDSTRVPENRRYVQACGSGPAKHIAKRDAIGRRPIVAKLKEILHVTNIDLWPDKNATSNVDVHPGAKMHLEMP